MGTADETHEEIVTKALGPFFVTQGWIPQGMLQDKGSVEKLME